MFMAFCEPGNMLDSLSSRLTRKPETSGVFATRASIIASVIKTVAIIFHAMVIYLRCLDKRLMVWTAKLS
jgi:hypothetical protein